MSLRKIFSVFLLSGFLVSCASKQDLIMEIKGSSHVLDEFYKGRAEPLKPMSTKEYEKAVEGGYEDELGVVGRREIKVRVKEKERQGDF